MFEKKYSKALTITLVVSIIAIVGLLGFLGYELYQKNKIEKEAASSVDEFGQDFLVEEGPTQENVAETDGNTSLSDQIDTTQTTTPTGQTKTKKLYLDKYPMAGTMEIPKINFKYPVLEEPSKKAIEVAVAVLYPVGQELNTPGNIVIFGHNYRNGLFFSNNKKLEIGDKIYITDNNNKKVTYTIYNKFETNSEDTSFYQRDTAGKAEITLSTCTDNSDNQRLIILARED